ncbi:hypothetical protein MBANPS3_007923 [Mucor bainieri]
MKLRSKKRRFLGNIKQEDCKPVFTTVTTTESSTLVATDTDIPNPNIKQEEDTKEDKALIEKDYYYCCKTCNKKMANLTSVLEHRDSLHLDSRLVKIRMIKHMDMEPDIHDPNFYCKPCECRYKNLHAYRYHLKDVHYMVLKRRPNWKTPHNNTVPDPNDPNLYCRACDHTYASKSGYKDHCRYVHGVKHVKYADQSSTSSSTADSYCQTCDRRLSSLRSYRRHLFVVHKVESRPPQQRKRSDILPNINDPNFYCQSCEKTYASRCSFREHLKAVHSIFQAAPRKKSRLNPDANDPNNYCRACQKICSNRGSYRRHLRMVHQMALSPLKVNANPTDLPDPYNPDYYCSWIQMQKSTLTALITTVHNASMRFITNRRSKST